MKIYFVRIKNKYNTMSTPVKASIWFFFCSIMLKGFSLISTPVFTRLMSTYQYGKVANYNSWYDLLFIFVTLGSTGAAYNNILAKNEDDHSKAKFSMMTFTVCLSFVWFLFYFLTSNFWNDYIQISTGMMSVMFVQFISITIFDFWSAGERYQYRYKTLVFVTIVNTSLSMIFAVVGVVFSEYKYEAKIIGNVVVGLFVASIIFIKSGISSKGKINPSYWKYAFKISLPLIPHGLSMKVLSQVDRVMITKMVGVEETGKYSIAYTLGLLMNILTDAINKSYCPYVYKKINEKNVKGVATTTTRLLILVMMSCCGSALFAPEIIRVFATEQYLEAMWIVPPVAMSVYFIFLYVIFSNVELYYEKTVFVSVASAVVALLNLGLNYVCIQSFGYLAAGYTTLICYVFLSFVHYLIVRKVIDNNAYLAGIFDFKKILLVSVVGVLLVFFCIAVYPYIYVRVAITVILLIICVINRKKIMEMIRKK